LIYFADTITRLGPEADGAVLVSGSHGGVYPGYLAASARAAAVILNDAGVGRDEAGIGSLAYLASFGIAAATVAHTSCRIGNTADMRERGIVSHCNGLAAALGVKPGDRCMDAAARMERASAPTRVPPGQAEARFTQPAPGPRRIVLMDSASLVLPEDAGQLVVTGSHGGLIGDVPAKALAVDAFAAVFHDAGIGIDRAGTTRLPALEARGIAAVTVAAASARIGDARSVFADGVISCANQTALRLGATLGEALAPRLALWSQLG
jgi:hypothetical protein